ncbi:unnamed protein product, partial [Prunus brigantina]
DHVLHIDAQEVIGRWKGEVGDGLLVPLTYRDDVERWNLYGSDLDNLPSEWEESSTELPEKRKASSRSIRDEDATSQSRDASPQRNKLRPPSAMRKSSLRRVSSIEKVPMGIAYSSSARIKRLVDANYKKVNSMQAVWDILLKSPPELLKTCDLPYKEVDQTERTVPLSSNHNSSVKPRTVKRGANFILQVAVMRARESFARAKSHSVERTTSPGVGDSSVGDEHLSDLLKMNFLSSPSACAKLVDHIHQASALDTFSSLSRDKQEEAAMYHLQNEIVFDVGAMRNS